MRKIILPALAAVFIFWSCSSSDLKNKSEPEKFQVTNPLIADTVFTTAYVADIHSLQNVEIRARIKGYIDKILVDEGKTVKAGQTLFTISSQYYVAELSKAQANFKSAQAELLAAELDVKNAQNLVEKSVVSSSELEVAKTKLAAAKAKVEEAKSDELSASLDLSYTEIKAPFDGVINRIPYKVGSLIEEGTLLTTISNNKEIFAYFNVTENEYLDFKTQNHNIDKSQVQLILANGQPYPHSGTIETVEGEFDRTTGNIAFRARFSNPDDLLKHGSNGKIILKRAISKGLLVPQKSTFEIQDKIFVYVLKKDNSVEKQTINIKFRIPNLYVIASGVSEKDDIVFEGIQYLKDGDKISPQRLSSDEMIKKLK